MYYPETADTYGSFKTQLYLLTTYQATSEGDSWTPQFSIYILYGYVG